MKVCRKVGFGGRCQGLSNKGKDPLGFFIGQLLHREKIVKLTGTEVVVLTRSANNERFHFSGSVKEMETIVRAAKYHVAYSQLHPGRPFPALDGLEVSRDYVEVYAPIVRRLGRQHHEAASYGCFHRGRDFGALCYGELACR